MNFAALINQHARSNPTGTAIIHEDTAWSYAELQTATDKFATHLEELNVNPRDRIAIYAPNVPEYVVSYLGALIRGAVPVPVNYRLRPGEIAEVIDMVSPNFIFTVEQSVSKLQNLQTNIATVALKGTELTVQVNDGKTRDDVSSYHEFEPALNEELASIMFTSGSTGQPKGVTHHHGYLWAVAMGRVNFVEVGSEDIALIASPLYHVSGQSVLLMTLYAGCPAVLLSEWDPDGFFRVVETHRVTFTHLITTVLVELVENHTRKAENTDMSALDTVFSGGGTLTEEQIRTFEDDFGGTVIEGYGRTEGGSTYNPPKARKLGSNGVPLRNTTQLKIINPENGNEAGVNEEGEIVARGEAVTNGYFEHPDLNKHAYEDGWMYTGDLGYFDTDGYLYFTGRKDDMIKTGGENVFPREVERVIMEIPEVHGVAVIGVPDSKWGEVISAAIVREDTEVDKQEIKEYCRTHLAGFKTPRKIIFVNTLPEQGTQKIDRKAVAELIANDSEL